MGRSKTKSGTAAVAYLRCSGLGQNDGDTWDRQEAAIGKYARAHGLTVADGDWFRDVGISGTKDLGDRPGLAALIDRIESNGPESRLCAQLMQIAAKLAGALNFSGESFEQEPGYILALLKRCLHWQNDAISTCHELISKCKDPAQEQALLAIRESIFAVRDQITEMRREYKQN
jgi:hypothetical protein